MTNKSKTVKTLKSLFFGSVIVAAISLFAWIVLEMYALFVYPDSFFTTFHNFEPLETAAPALYTSTMIFMIVGLVASAVAAMARKLKDCVIQK